MKMLPPRWMMRFFQWFCREELYEAVEGDLLHLYQKKREKKGRFRVNCWYFFTLATFLQPFALRNRTDYSRLTFMDMLNNYFKIAWRNLSRHKAYTLINLSGLAIGIAAAVIMTSYVVHELSYDRFHEKADRIYRLVYDYEARGTKTEVSKSAFPLKFMFLEEYPGVEKVVRFYQNRQDAATLRYEEKHHTEDAVVFADPEVFEVFDFKLLQGDPLTALKDMNSIVLTENAARRYFGDEDPLGKFVQYKNKDLLKVTGILEEVPKNSHIDFEILLPMELQRRRWMRPEADNNGYDFEADWRWSGAWQYILLENEAAAKAFSEKVYEEGKDFFGRTNVVEYHHELQPLTEIHLNSNKSAEFKTNGSKAQVMGFTAIALLILIIACINFVNLSTARSAKRAKEVGLRKVMGAFQPQLVSQFITESVLIAMGAMLLAMFLTRLMLPFFNHFMNTELSIPFGNPLIILAILVGALIVGILSGMYPAFYLSRFQPIKTLKGNSSRSGAGNQRLQKVLVTLQFTISNLLIIGILVVQNQVDFVRGKELGFDKDQVIVLKHGGKLDEGFELFDSKLDKIASVEAVNQGYVAGTRDWVQSFRVNGEALSEAKSMGIKHVGFDFLKMFDMELVAGRYFTRGVLRDRRKAILLNEAAVRNFGWTNEEALTKTFSYVGGSDNKTRFECRVIGVLADAHLESLYQAIRPSVFKFAQWGDISVKFNAPDMKTLRAGIAEVEAAWDEVIPDWPFEFEYLDETIEAQYAQEERLSQTIRYFTLLAVFIACLGLFGLASANVQERTREIGIRKVLGASVNSILRLVSRTFVALVAISFLVAVPVGYYLSEQWLQGFAYRTDVGAGIFLIAGIVTMIIALLAVSGQSLRAAYLNPASTLKHE